MRRATLTTLAALLTACATSTPDDSGTLKSLERRQVAIERDSAIEANRAAATRAYHKFIEAAPADPLRPEAMRRLGDLEIEGAQAEASASNNEFRNAVKVYEDLLRVYPKQAGNDRVLYQLAHAYDQVGDSRRALATLERLVTEYPASRYHNEAEFRRGELLLMSRDFSDAERAYRVVLQQGERSPFYERALYMHGWSLFKQAQLEQGLHSFFAVLDRKLIGRDATVKLEDLIGLTRADRELIEDTFRVVSLSLVHLQGPESVPGYFTTASRRQYEYRVYEQLGELYLKQERVKDAADTFNAFARRYPTHPQAPLLQVRAIQSYQSNGFAALALEAKKEYVERYGVNSEFRRANSAASYERVLPYVKTHLEELARHYHAVAQKHKKNEDYQEAARWYWTYLDSFATDPKAPSLNFLLGEALFEHQRYAEAALEYERTAYNYPPHEKSADAGYSALLAYTKQEAALQGEAARQVRGRAVDSALRFADTYATDARAPGVLTNAAEKLYAIGAGERAISVAQRVLALAPAAPAGLRRTAWTVRAHAEFDGGAFGPAERAYTEALALTPETTPARAALNERLAAAVYKQGEHARTSGDTRVAVHHFLRVGLMVPGSSIRANAQYDAAAGMIALKEWDSAARVLEDFRKQYPNHALQSDVPAKLALCYVEAGQPFKAAAEFEKLAAGNKDIGFSRDALWRAAELYEQAGHEANAANAFERYVRAYPRPLEPAIEARSRLIKLAEKRGQKSARYNWSRELYEAEQKGGAERTARTRYLGALSTLVVVEPAEASYREVRLVEPLKKNLKIKKERMQKVLQAYGVAAEYGVTEVATAATYRTADLYNDFGKALMESQRPKGLKGDELEQYNVMLEEQAFPFEEKAIELHEINARRVRDGLYDQWVRQSFTALSKLRPVRYAKAEKGEKVINGLH